jgi:hypothetical protein
MVPPEATNALVNSTESKGPDAAGTQQDSPATPPLSPMDYQDLNAIFFEISHALWALLFAYLGGCLTRAFYDRRPFAPAEGGTVSRP